MQLSARHAARALRVRSAPWCIALAVFAAVCFIASGVNVTHMRQASAPIETTISRRVVNVAKGAPASQTASKTTRQLGSPAEHPFPLVGCLITKWQSIWLVHPNKTRSHVATPTEDCDLRALEIEDETLDKYPKAHGGEGLYSLSPALSATACRLAPCPGASARAAGVPPASSAPADGLPAPPHGWGMGVAPGWMDLVSLRFNTAAIQAFGDLRLKVGEPLLLVFGGASVNDMLRNWAIHVRKLGLPYTVACMDEALFNLANSHGIPGVMMVEKDDVGEKEVTTKWKYFRMDPAAFMTMGILKVRFFIEFMTAGFDVLCADLDVVWLRDPRPWINGFADPSALLLPFPDVIVSTDVTHGGADSDERKWGMLEEMNTGMLLLRSSPGAVAVCLAWVDRMRQEMVSIRKLPKNMLQWWSNDQTFFNEVIHRASSPLPVKGGGTAAQQLLREGARHASRAALLEMALANLTTLEPAQYRAVRGVLLKRVRRGTKHVTFSIATFPFTHFASGHTYFTQSLQDRLGFVPVAVHTTFQFGDTAEAAWGKRSRLREKLLWKVDDDAYYARAGSYSPGKGADETGYTGFIHLTGQVDRVRWPLSMSLADFAVKLEGKPSFIKRALSTWGDVSTFRTTDPNYHLIMESFQRRLVHDALALGRATKRKVIMPKLTCWVDRYWNNLEKGRFPGVAQEQHPLPFHCPFDHLFDLDKWVHSDVPMREYSFLDNERIKAEDRNDSVYLRVTGDEGAPPQADGDRVLQLEPGDNYAQVAEALAAKGWAGAYVLKVDARSLELLCEDLGSVPANQQFNSVMHTVLGIAEQIRYCDASENPRYNGRQDDYSNPINCTWGFHRPPPLPENMEARGGCPKTAVEMIAFRQTPPGRSWDWQEGSSRQEAWSTRDRPGYLYRQYM
ncbi:hypothetical protein AB1Y20_003794 [Prymnesium parvum]|uniref:Nucleotide-diphospho-sugar transferase domain-containing protein n=1 Tax=Prymnesium parvum TaxID=97485 RepID=A0AB34J5T7_PRYPA